MKKKTISLLLAAAVLMLLLPVVQLGALAEDSGGPSFEFKLSASSLSPIVGDAVTVTLTLGRTDAAEPYRLYSMQDEIKYDATLLSLVEDSVETAPNFSFSKRAMSDGIHNKLVFSYVDFSGAGMELSGSLTVATFKLKTLRTGDAALENTDYKVNKRDGSGVYASTGNKLSLTIYKGGTGGGASSSQDPMVIRQSGSRADVVVKDADLGSVVKKAEEKGSVSIDVSGKKDVDTVSLPKNAVSAFAESEKIKTLSIACQDATLTFDDKALDAAAEKMNADTDRLSVSAKRVQPDSLSEEQKKAVGGDAVILSVSVSLKHYDAGGNETGSEAIHELGGKLEISFPYEMKEGQTENTTALYFLADDGTLTLMSFVYRDGKIMLTTEHCSYFAAEYCPCLAFADVDINGWYKNAINYVLDKKLMNGVGPTEFKPGGTTTRAQFVTVLGRLAGAKVSQDADTGFSDVVNDGWSAGYIKWAAENGIVKGYENGTFGQYDEITREQMAAILYRFAKYQGRGVSAFKELSAYADSGRVSSWAREAMSWACAEGLIAGVGEARLDPSGKATRAQMATILMRYCKG